MAYGFRIYKKGSADLLISVSSLPAAIRDVLLVPAGASGYRDFPELSGQTLSVSVVSSTMVYDFRGGQGSISAVRATAEVSYPNGIPRVSWYYTQTRASDVFVDSTIYIFSS